MYVQPTSKGAKWRFFWFLWYALGILYVNLNWCRTNFEYWTVAEQFLFLQPSFRALTTNCDLSAHGGNLYMAMQNFDAPVWKHQNERFLIQAKISQMRSLPSWGFEVRRLIFFVEHQKTITIFSSVTAASLRMFHHGFPDIVKSILEGIWLLVEWIYGDTSPIFYSAQLPPNLEEIKPENDNSLVHVCVGVFLANLEKNPCSAYHSKNWNCLGFNRLGTAVRIGPFCEEHTRYFSRSWRECCCHILSLVVAMFRLNCGRIGKILQVL